MSIFDKLLEQVEESDRAVFQKYPKVQEAVVDLDTRISAWEDWRTTNYDETTNMTKNAVEALRRKDAEIEALRVLQGNDMTWDEMKDNVGNFLTERGVITKQDFEKDYLPKFDLKPLETKLTNLERGMEFTYAKTAHLPVQHMQEFGKNLKIEDLFKYMNENKITNFDDAYDRMVAPERTKVAEAKSKEREEQIRKEAREEALRDVRTGQSPTDTGGTAPEATPLQQRIAAKKGQVADKDAAPKLTPGDLGSGVGAQDAYQAYLRDQASGKRPTTVQ